MTDDPFPYSMIQKMEREHGFKVTEEDMDAAIAIGKKLCREQNRAFDLDAVAGFIVFVAARRAIVMSIPPDDRERFLDAWDAHLKADKRAELIILDDDPA